MTCGTGTQSRQVLCRPEGYESISNPPILPESQCNPNTKPDSQKPCTLDACGGLTTPGIGQGIVSAFLIPNLTSTKTQCNDIRQGDLANIAQFGDHLMDASHVFQ